MNRELDLFRGTFGSNAWTPIREFNRLFTDLAASGDLPMGYAPACDLEENEKNYLLTMDLPGVVKNDVKIELHDRQLIVTGEKRTEKTEDRKLRHFVERTYGSFRRAFTFPAEVDVEHAEAAFDNGVLTVTVPKAIGAKPRQIKVT